MGFLTTITFRNDDYHTIRDNRIQVVDSILDAMTGTKNADSRLGMIIQKPVQSNENILYFSCGNTVVQINDDLNDAFVDDAIATLSRQLTALKSRRQSATNQTLTNADILNDLNIRQEQLFNELRRTNSNDASVVQNSFENIMHLESCKTMFEIETTLAFDDALYMKVMQYFYDYENYFNRLR